MSSLLAPTHPFFAISPERARSYVTWGRRLAQAEGIILLIGACAMLPPVDPGFPINPFSIGVAALGFLSLTLAWYLGGGSPSAAVILLGLSISRAAMLLVPGAPDAWATAPILALLELFVFGQAARGAIALAKPQARENPEAPIIPSPRHVASVAQTRTAPPALDPNFKWPVAWTEEPQASHPTWINGFGADLAVAAIVAGLGLYALTRPIPHNEGLQGMSEALTALVGLFNLLPAALLVIGGNAARKDKTWGRRLRFVVYFFFASEVLIWIQFSLL